MSSLYQITEQLSALDALLQDAGGDVSEGTSGESLERWMKEYEWQQRDKVDAYGGLIANLSSDIDALCVESKRLNDRAKVLVNRIDRMKIMAKFAMDTRGIKKLEGQKFTISIQKNGGLPSLEVLVEADKLPEQFIKIERRPDNDKIRKGLEVSDPEAMKVAVLRERGESVRIR